jgi:hypothetical protein
MRLFQRARASYALSLILCAVLLSAMAVPAFAGNDGARADRASQAEQAQAKDDNDAKAKKAKKAKRAQAAAQSSSSSESSSKASSRGQSAAKSSNASSQGQRASAAKSSNASSASKGKASAKADKPAKAEQRDAGEAKAAGENSPAGNKGSMKVRPVGTAVHPPRNYAHLPCVVQVDFYGSPHSGATLTAVSHAPTAPTGQSLLTRTMTFSQSSPNPRGNELVGTTTLDFTSVVSGLSYHEQQGYHVKLTAAQDGPQGGDVKHKVFWIDCGAPAAADEDVEVSAGGTAMPGGLDAEDSDARVDVMESQVGVEREVGDVMGLSGSA